VNLLLVVIVLIILIFYLGSHLKWWDNASSIVSGSAFSQAESPTSISSEDDSDLPFILYDENGREYFEVVRTNVIPRKTYIKGVLSGKYRGEFDQITSVQFQQSDFFDIEIYEAILENASYSIYPFDFIPEVRIPSEKIPRPLIVSLEENSSFYEIDLKEPLFSGLNISRKLHQEHDKYVFGTLEVHVTGYVLDFLKEDYIDREYVVSADSVPSPILLKTGVPTGNVEISGSYKRSEYYYSDMEQTYWGVWEYGPPINRKVQGFGFGNIGCFSLIFRALVFLFSLVLVASFLFLIVRSLSSIRWNINPITRSEEVIEEREALIDSIGSEALDDSLIRHKRVWRDYDGNVYQGVIWTKVSDYRLSSNFKSNLNLSNNNTFEYDQMVINLSRNDQNRLSGVYSVFDSIQSKHNLSSTKFAELVVSFVQDIPYSVVLSADCDPNLYDDDFIKEYLASADALCYGNQKFGINTPVEFMTTMYGDCDTRTLLLYTILEHYNYDVALMSSEYYGHSILGVNIPVSGTAIYHENHRYVLWETTSPNLSAGVLPDEISDLNYWRISIKSK
jgi:hypothetical protein